MKKAVVGLCCFFLLSNFLMAAGSSDSLKTTTEKRQKFDPARDAKKDIADAIGLAKKTNRRILLDIGGEWCIWCHRLDSLFIQNPDLQDYLTKHYVVVKVNVSDENKNKEALAPYPVVQFFPHIFILNKNGILIHSQDTGVLEYPKGHPIRGHDKEKVFAFLKKWAK